MQPSAEEGVPPTEAALRAELASLKLRQLYKRAAQEGVPEAELEDAEEGPDPKGAAIALILERTRRAAAATHLRAELSSLKLRAVFRRAEEMGVPEASLEVAEEAADPKAAAIDLILGVQAALLAAPAPGAAQPAPEPEQATREVHSASAADTVLAVDVTGAADWQLTPIQPSDTADFLPALCIFGSMRFPVPPEARMLFAALQAAGLYLKIVDMRAGQDIDKEVYGWIEHCCAFLAFGTKNYGEDTGNSACTYKEVKYAQAKKKNIILLRMIPWEQEFEELQARVLFNQNMLTLEWQQGQAMPPSLVGEILKAMGLPTTGAPGSPAAVAHETAVARSAVEAANVSRAQAEAARAQAQAQLAQAQASAAAASARAEAARVQAEAARAQAEAEEAVAMAAAEEEAARRLQEEVRAAEAAERQRKEQAQRQAQKAATLSELETAEPARAMEVLSRAAEDAEIQAAGWAIVWRRSDAGRGRANAYGNGIGVADGVEALVATVQQHCGAAEVMEPVLHAAWILCRDAHQTDNAATFASAGGISAVVAGMGAHVGSAAVQEQGCGALWNLALNSDARKGLIKAAGAIPRAQTAQRAHPGAPAAALARDLLGILARR